MSDRERHALSSARNRRLNVAFPDLCGLGTGPIRPKSAHAPHSPLGRLALAWGW